MTIRYPTSFQDEIEGKVVGTGYRNLLMSQIDNYKWLQAVSAQKRLSDSASLNNTKKVHKDANGCIKFELGVGEKNTDKDAKKTEILTMRHFPHRDC